MSAALEQETPKKRRKRREVQRRRVVNLPDDYSWWLEENLKTLGYESVPEALRELSRIGLEHAHSVGRKEIKVAYKKHELEKMQAEIDALEDDD